MASAVTPAAGTTGPIDNPHTEAALSGLQLVGSEPGVSPFIQWLSLQMNSTINIKSVEFRIQPKPSSVSQPVDVSFSRSALVARGYMPTQAAILTIPVFALYDGYTNQVTLNFTFKDGSSRSLTTSITTADYADPTGIYQHPTIVRQRTPGSALGFDFFFMKSGVGSPIIVDTDGAVRWAVPGVSDSVSTAFQSDQFVTGDASAAIVHRIRLDGTATQSALTAPSITFFHHNIDYGNTGLLAEVNTQTNGVQNMLSNIIEITDLGSVLNQWDLGAIIGSYMQSMGDDAGAFVRPGVDWFHSNATTYDPSDDTLIVSSRENFVVKLDYHTGEIIWIFGDPSKYWYTFPSLRAKALSLAPRGLYPIGQHAVSLTTDGHLLLFNDGLGSQNQPAGAPAGETRTYSAVSAYSIDTGTMTAKNVWNFEDGQTIYSYICSSAYKAPENSLLIDYATANAGTLAVLMGLDANHKIAFEFQYPTQQCATSWNAGPIALENLTID